MLTAPALPVLAALALLVNAFIWGVSWWPFRYLQSLGVHPLWATSLTYAVVVALIVAHRPRVLRQLFDTPTLWVLACAAGCTNAAFNWAVSIGDVVRVVLLFYLMPLWSVLLARLLLGERLTSWAALRVGLALAGAAVVLKPPGAGWPLPSSLADWLGLAGGISFALNNVMLRRESHRPPEARALAMFFGGMAVAGALALILGLAGQVDWPPAPRADWVLAALLLTGAMLAANLALQHGAGYLSASTTSVIMLTEVVFATASSVWWGEQLLTAQVALGGGMIVAAAVLAGFDPGPRRDRP